MTTVNDAESKSPNKLVMIRKKNTSKQKSESEILNFFFFFFMRVRDELVMIHVLTAMNSTRTAL